MTPKNLPNGTAETPTQLLNSFAPVVGINFGNSFASIAVLTKVKKTTWVFDSMANLDLQEGLAECIANEDGERQIACAVAFQGEELVRAFFLFVFTLTLVTLHSTLAIKPDTS